MSFEKDLLQAKRGNLGQLLFRCSRLLNEQGVSRIQSFFPGVRASHTSLLPHIDLEGTRMVELARRAGISKQAVGQLVQEMEGLGLLVRSPDPEDGRAWRVSFSELGRQALLQGLAQLRQMQQEMKMALGRERVERLVEDLGCLLDYLESKPAVTQGESSVPG
ncbi:winged helix-turn-helix transcriptional regulator [bacterium]|nr:winged helix-turn-helix transcriptional regulator [bacterium]